LKLELQLIILIVQALGWQIYKNEAFFHHNSKSYETYSIIFIVLLME